METISINIAEQNAELVRRGYVAFNHADMNTLAELFHEQCSWHTPGKSHIAGDCLGRNATFAHFGQYGQETKGTFKAILKHVAMCDDGTIVGIHRNTGERNGKILNVDCCILFEFEDGQMIRGKEFFYDLNAWDEFWS